MSKKKTVFLWVLVLTLIVTAFGLFTACSDGKENLHINVPSERLTAELGSYDLPKYDVVNDENLIMAGYLVVVDSVTDPDGEDVPVSYGKINATKTGVYRVIYSAGPKVPKATLEVDFADRTPPTVEITGGLPDFYIVGFTYNLPEYSITDGPDLNKCRIKVYYKADDGADRVEVAVENSRFEVAYNTGSYIIVIHAEDAAGNSKDYEYEVEAVGPDAVVPGKVVYFDEPFGMSQVKTLWNGFHLSYTTEKAYGEEAGSTKVVTDIDTDYIMLDRIIESDVSEYTHLVVRIYNDNDFPVYSGYCWFADLTLAPHAWTELKIPVSDLDERNVSHPSVAGIVINSRNITNLSLRLFSSYDTNAIPKNSKFYFSAMYAVVEEIGEPDDVIEGKIAYFDESYGLGQVSLYWPAPHALSFDPTVKYGEEKGSLKVTVNTAQDNYIILNNPYIADVSEYDYLVFRVYNPTSAAFSIGTTWAADTVIAANGWTEVRIATSLFGAEGSVTDMDSKKLLATDITKLPIRIFGTESFPAGESFYISAMYGGNAAEEPAPEEVVAGKVAYFDESYGLLQVSLYWADPHTLSFDPTVKYGEEKGSLKVTVNIAQDNYIILDKPYIADVSEYDYLVFRVYNPTNAAFSIGTTWAADTVIAANDWTEVKIATSLFGAEGSITDMDNKKLLTTDITKLPIRIFGADAFPVGESFYISALYGGNASEEPAPEEVVAGKVAYFDESYGLLQVSLYWADPHTLSFDPTVKYGEEKGSLKVTVNVAQDNYIILDKPYIADVSEYDYLVFRVYNPTSAAFSIGTTWAADTVIAANGWTEVRIATSLFGAEGSITDMDNKKLLATDITKLPIRIFGAASFPAGESFYISAVYGENLPKPAGNTVADFDKESGISRVANDTCALSYDTTVKYGEEAGSMKVTVNAVAGEHYIFLNNPCIKDVSGFDYLVFRIYNPTGVEFQAGVNWAADTTITANGDWTEVKIAVSLFAEGKIDSWAGTDISATDITGLTLRIMSASGLTVGMSFYISAVYGETNA